MSKTAIVKTGEQFFIKQLSKSQPIKLDRVIFANINGVNGNTNIDTNSKMPAQNQIVYTAPVTQCGLLNDKTVVYSVILDTSVGDFSFNYIGLVNSETDTLCMVMHTDLTKKIKTAGQRQGNTITESIWLEIDNASESTGITVNAQTWQIDYSKRLAGEDERIRLTNYDLYNRLAIHSGFTITKNNNQLTVSAGLAYVAGLRVEHIAQKAVKVKNNQSLYIDAWLAGTVTGEWSVNYNLIAGTNLKDYEKNRFKHFVERVASVDANGKLVVVKPKSFITTYDHATTEKTGIVRLNSSTNSTSETEAATPLAVKKAYDLAAGAVKISGDEMTGQLRMSAESAGIKFKYVDSNNEFVLRTLSNSLSFIFYDEQIKKWSTKLAYITDKKQWCFLGVDDVTINNKSVLKTGDYGIGAATGAIAENFDDHLVGGFYQCRTTDFSDLQLSGNSTATLLAYPSNSSTWKIEQLSVVNSKEPRIYYRCDTKEGKQKWHEAITTANINSYLPAPPPPQNWYNVMGQRGVNIVYTNTTGRPIFVMISMYHQWSGTETHMTLSINGMEFFASAGGAGSGSAKTVTMYMPIPAGCTYKVSGYGDLTRWFELR
ncbi:phage tail-collar fiber domain-containing protein [Gilliamella sp. Nev3-1]|uniref:phage tail-collar fiber domain-containing protein n=1 Tax=Gilliamella sp. Nev3-1 TaxID=3120250 RepID=UPI00080E7A3E|nr:phage tail protein [Gilliamella apicola]OCG60813.1 hypothetical protein A9G40_03090 [Gilliamella apicola]